MKNFVLILISIFLFKFSKAQVPHTFLTFGYNVGFSNGQKVVNTFVKDYNNSRPYLSQKMNSQDLIQGFTGSVGWGKDGNGIGEEGDGGIREIGGADRGMRTGTGEGVEEDGMERSEEQRGSEGG